MIINVDRVFFFIFTIIRIIVVDFKSGKKKSLIDGKWKIAKGGRKYNYDSPEQFKAVGR